MFRAIILPIFRSTKLCVRAYVMMFLAGSLDVEELRFKTNGRQHHGSIIPQAVTHNLVLLRMGKIIARNMLK